MTFGFDAIPDFLSFSEYQYVHTMIRFAPVSIVRTVFKLQCVMCVLTYFSVRMSSESLEKRVFWAWCPQLKIPKNLRWPTSTNDHGQHYTFSENLL